MKKILEEIRIKEYLNYINQEIKTRIDSYSDEDIIKLDAKILLFNLEKELNLVKPVMDTSKINIVIDRKNISNPRLSKGKINHQIKNANIETVYYTIPFKGNIKYLMIIELPQSVEIRETDVVITIKTEYKLYEHCEEIKRIKKECSEILTIITNNANEISQRVSEYNLIQKIETYKEEKENYARNNIAIIHELYPFI